MKRDPPKGDGEPPPEPAPSGGAPGLLAEPVLPSEGDTFTLECGVAEDVIEPPPWSRDEFERLLLRFPPNGNGTAANANEAPTPSFTTTEVTAWHGKPVPEREWTMHNRIMRRTVALLSGEGAIGKSILSMQLCVAHVLTGADWFGTLPVDGPALYIDAEDEDEEIQRRFVPILEHYRTSFDKLAGLHIKSLAGRDAVLGAAHRDGIVRPTTLFHQLLETVTRLNPVFIAINSAADVFAVNENDRGQARQSVGLLRTLAIAGNSGVLLSAHPSMSGMDRDTGSSGSTAWNNSVRSRLYLKSAGDADSDLRVLEMKKSNYGPRGESIRLRWENGVFKPVATPTTIEQAAKDAEFDAVFLRLLGRFNDNGQDLSPNPSSIYAPSTFAKLPEANGIKSEDFAKAMQRLIEDKRVVIVDEGSRSKPRKRVRLAGLRLVR